jgi:hypothetical protein
MVRSPFLLADADSGAPNRINRKQKSPERGGFLLREQAALRQNREARNLVVSGLLYLDFLTVC